MSQATLQPCSRIQSRHPLSNCARGNSKHQAWHIRKHNFASLHKSSKRERDRSVWSIILKPLASPTFDVVERTGVPNLARCTEEGLDARVRENSVTGHWHPLNVSLRILNSVGDRADMAHSVESRVAFLDHHVVDYVNTLPPPRPSSLKLRPIAGASPGKWHLVEKWILRQAVKPFVTEEVYLRKKVAFNPPPQPRPSGAPPRVASESQMQLLPLQTHLKARITQASVQRLGFFNWPYIEGQLSEYLASPEFLPNGRLDPRASML
ncbi:hypothetical protein GGX14DRAFT_390171 [Mycena pura]|uniref:Asparagine synthetase domain-containing protein n=1 Tax=Mycena pura TaxID=153505 RepID=A0AAD6VNJ7_9AGAR|nr:hypothetical protein GGX14DRAFT_390171 [Mycena pura]